MAFFGVPVDYYVVSKVCVDVHFFDGAPADVEFVCVVLCFPCVVHFLDAAFWDVEYVVHH